MPIFVTASHQTGLDAAGLCWSSAHLVWCGPDEPSWAWTQIWIQEHMPDYSLNWTAMSRAIQRVEGVNDAACPPEGGPAEAGGHTATSAFVGQCLIASKPTANQCRRYRRQGADRYKASLTVYIVSPPENGCEIFHYNSYYYHFYSLGVFHWSLCDSMSSQVSRPISIML